MSAVLAALEREWAVFMENRPGPRSGWTQDQKWRVDNPGGQAALLAYRSGGPRPEFPVSNEPGRRMTEHLDAWHAAQPTPPPPGGLTLPRRPPGLIDGADRMNPANYRDPSGKPFVVVDVPAVGGSLRAIIGSAANDQTSYFLRGLNVQRTAPSSGARVYGLNVDVGHWVVAIGGRSKVVSTATSTDASDPVAIQVDDGPAGGIRYFEGVEMDSVNAFGFRTKTTCIRQACKLTARAKDDVMGDAHPDGVQGWDRGPSALQFDSLVKIDTWMQAMASLLAPNPTRWERGRVYVTQHSAANAVYFDAGNTPDPTSGPWCMYPAGNHDLWLTTAFYSPSYRQKLDDVMCLKRILPGNVLECWPYEMTPGPGQPGTRYVSPDRPTGGSGGSTGDLGRRQGDTISFDRVPHIREKWTWGVPAGGIPEWTAGVDYEPLEYA